MRISNDTVLLNRGKNAIHVLHPSIRVKKIEGYGVSSQWLAALNIKHLEHDYYTDIISFDYSKGNKISGELYVSVERVEENALALGMSYESELKRVVAHGILHLIGFKDKTEVERAVMRSKEDEVLAYIDKYGS